MWALSSWWGTGCRRLAVDRGPGCLWCAACVVPAMAASSLPSCCPRSESPLCSKVYHFPQSWQPYIQCRAVTWNKQGWNNREAQAGADARLVAENPAATSAVSLCPLHAASGASQRMHALHELSSGFPQPPPPPVSLSSPPTSQGGLSALCQTSGLWSPICDLNCPCPREDVCPRNLPFPLSPLPRSQVLTWSFLCSSYPITCEIFLMALVVSESFYHFPVSFQWE